MDIKIDYFLTLLILELRQLIMEKGLNGTMGNQIVHLLFNFKQPSIVNAYSKVDNYKAY
ncbi:hypothetical protein NLM59_07285 [Weeksellaceae bacterium KMM 9724]|uniref:hypothetical protein n=1 Tax=Profundicola chukchiensis TaxID=2961959 RepID=UPI00243BDA4A|nr:hypothetical protein [Profundicola chukchiensis]MDG4950723.1 hypothetical protein [Profundicola chukchiensis]